MRWTPERRRSAIRLFIEERSRLELTTASAAIIAALGPALYVSKSSLAGSFPAAARSGLYISLTATTAALLGFVLAGLAILIALPTGDRLDQLQGNENWGRIPGTFVRAAAALLASLFLATLALGVDLAVTPRLYVELPLVGLTMIALVRVIATIVALEAVVAVTTADLKSDHGISDP